MVTVVIIGLLISVAIFGYTRVQSDARNSERISKIKILSEALEAYYGKNGEYPSCSAMTQSANQVTTTVLPGLDPKVLVAPRAPSGTTNSITCTALSSSGPDAFGYIGDGSATCATGSSCLQYTLQYRNENNSNIVAQDSTHRTQVTGAEGITISATVISATQVNLSWTAVQNATGYQLQRATNTGFTTNLVTSSPSGTTASATGLTSGTTYYFRVAAVGSTGQGAWSNTIGATPGGTPTTPTTPTASASLVGTDAVGTSSVVTCAVGTPEYQLRQRNTVTTTTGTWSAWSAWSTSRTLTVAASQGYQYSFQASARCTSGGTSSAATAGSNIPTIVRPIDTPPAPTYLTPAYFDSPNSAVVNYSGSCPSGTSVIEGEFRSRAWTGSTWGPYDWGFLDYWTNNSGSNKNVEYWGKYQCYSVYSTSPWSPESYNVIVVTP